PVVRPPFVGNTTCDLYRSGNAPPADPDIAGIRIYLRPDWQRGQESGDFALTTMCWTHVADFPFDTDLRHWRGAANDVALQATIDIRHKDGTAFRVVLTESRAHVKVAYLARGLPPWPTAQL